MHGLTRATRLLHTPGGCGRRLFSASASRPVDFTHVVVGGGVVGLAVAKALAERAGPGSVLLLERHAAVGTETSARNSEVIHAGLYYGSGSLKTQLCIRGRQQLYAFCAAHGVGHRRTGKWLVAQTAGQHAALATLHDFAAAYNRDHGANLLPLRWLSTAEHQRREPAVRAAAGVLESTATGIIDSHGLMAALQGGLEAAGGEVALQSPVTAIAPLGDRGRAGWAITVQPPVAEAVTIEAASLVNAAGLGAAAIHNMITQRPDAAATPDGTPPSPPATLYYAKGNYFSYAASTPKVSTLVYPAPEPGLAGLGTHLTLDLAGRIRFGPDVEWVDSPDDLTVDAGRLPRAIPAIQAYLPSIDPTALQPDYAGIRPKLVPAGQPAADFVIRREPDYHGWVNLLGIESPGLTSSLAIGDMVRDLLYT